MAGTRFRKTVRDSVVSTITGRAKGPTRRAGVRMSKDDVQPDKLFSCLTIAVQSALRDLGVKLDITIRETPDSYEVVVEE